MEGTRMLAEHRSEFGKGASRRLRRDRKIPAVMYGHGMEPVHLSLPGHQVLMATKAANPVFTLVIDGAEQLALVKDVQRDPIKPVIKHLDLVAVRRGEQVSVDVPVTLLGEGAPDTMVMLESQTLSVSADAMSIPEMIEVSVEGLAPGTQILAGQVLLPPGVRLLTDTDTLVVHLAVAGAPGPLEPESTEGEGGKATYGEPASDAGGDQQG